MPGSSHRCCAVALLLLAVPGGARQAMQVWSALAAPAPSPASCPPGLPRGTICDRALGVALAPPPGWVLAPPRQFTPGSLSFVTSLRTMALRLAIQPLGPADTRFPGDAAAAGAAALTQGLRIAVDQEPTTVAGTPAVLLRGLPGAGPTIQIVVAHAGAVYVIVAFGTHTVLQPDHQQALASLRFIPRTGPFPPAGTPQPYTAVFEDPCQDLAARAQVGTAAGRAPLRLRATYTVVPSPGNELVVAHVRATSLRPGARVTLTICWNTGLPALYTRYQVTALPPAAAGTLRQDIALFVPTDTFAAWTVHVVATDTATGRRLATLTRSGQPPVPAHSIRVTPRSRPVVPGRAYPFRLYTHCGVGFAVDFDGAFWDLADAVWAGSYGNPPAAIGNPFQEGTMALLDRTHARFDFPDGSIHFTRHVGPKVLPGYCA